MASPTRWSPSRIWSAPVCAGCGARASSTRDASTSPSCRLRPRCSSRSIPRRWRCISPRGRSCCRARSSTRGPRNLTLDSPQDLRRIVVGDSFAGSSGLGGSLILGGVSVTREYALDPYFVRQPLPRLSAAILSPSVLDVYVNGALVRQEAIAPGRFEVRNLPVTNGAGQVSYVVRDSFGRTQEYSSSYYGSPGVRAPGLGGWRNYH